MTSQKYSKLQNELHQSSLAMFIFCQQLLAMKHDASKLTSEHFDAMYFINNENSANEV